MGIREKRRRANLAARFFFYLIVVAACAVAALAGLAMLGGPAAGTLGPGDPDLNPAERALLIAYLTARSRNLNAPAGPDGAPVPFSVAPGETARAVATRLAEAGLVSDSQLLAYYLQYQGLDSQVEAGDFILRQTMTIPEVALALTDARAREGVFRVIEGWRVEQVVEALAAHPALAGVAQNLATLTGPGSPRPGNHAFLRQIPPGASLEGYLFPDTYLLKPDASASDLLELMLANFEAQLPSDYQARLDALGLTLNQAVTVASLIEREAVVDDERPLIASVIYNRLAVGQQLEIDATVQYALGAPGAWWPRLEGVDLRSIQSAYNTYAVAGLPPGPIANPGLQSLLAAANPAQSDYLYYRAMCDGSKRHAFAFTYDEHLANACP